MKIKLLGPVHGAHKVGDIVEALISPVIDNRVLTIDREGWALWYDNGAYQIVPEESVLQQDTTLLEWIGATPKSINIEF